MNDDGTTLFGLNRSALTAIGLILIVVGLVLFLTAASIMMAPQSNPFDFAATQARMYSVFVTAFIGVIFFGLGFGLLRFGMVRPVTSYLASEASPAIEQASEAVAEGLKEGFGRSPLRDEAVVKVRCRNCGYLENEDAAFCGRCGKPL